MFSLSSTFVGTEISTQRRFIVSIYRRTPCFIFLSQNSRVPQYLFLDLIQLYKGHLFLYWCSNSFSHWFIHSILFKRLGDAIKKHIRLDSFHLWIAFAFFFGGLLWTAGAILLHIQVRVICCISVFISFLYKWYTCLCIDITFNTFFGILFCVYMFGCFISSIFVSNIQCKYF